MGLTENGKKSLSSLTSDSASFAVRWWRAMAVRGHIPGCLERDFFPFSVRNSSVYVPRYEDELIPIYYNEYTSRKRVTSFLFVFCFLKLYMYRIWFQKTENKK